MTRFLLLLLFPFAVSAQYVDGNFVSGNELYDRCLKSQGFCLGYVAAVQDGTRYATCTPADIKLGQLADVVLKHLTNNPEARHLDADVLVIDAIKRAWPCPPGVRGAREPARPSRNSL